MELFTVLGDRTNHGTVTLHFAMSPPCPRHGHKWCANGVRESTEFGHGQHGFYPSKTVAYLRKDNRTGNWFVCFRWNNAQHNKSCSTTKRSEADLIRLRVKDTIQLLRTGRIQLPGEVDPGNWILAGGKTIANGNGAPNSSFKASALQLGNICDDYFEDQARKADTTLQAEQVHIKHLKGHLGSRRKITSIELSHLKQYLNQRLQEKYRGKPITGATVKKEFATFRQIWVWAQRNRKLQIPCPLLGPNGRWEVPIPKPAERIKFQTWRQIEKRISRGGLTEEEQQKLWTSLFLDYEQVKALLDFVRTSAAHPFIYPMFAFAAYTGARRSEICRSQVGDFDFDENIILIRERKRRKDLSATTRFVPMHPELRTIMLDWFEQHPGGQHTLVLPLRMRGQKLCSDPQAITPGKATTHFKTALKSSQWKVVRGFHVLRHSFGSNLARTGKVSSEEIGKWMGHTTDEMRELYQHLFPQDGLAKISALV